MEQAAAAGVPSSTREALAALLFGIFIAAVGNSFVFALLPPLGRELGLRDIQTGLIVGVSSVLFMLMARFWGGKSEQWGRRPVLLFGMTSYFALSMLFAGVVQFALSGAIPVALIFPLMLFTRSLFTTCIAGIFPASQAYIADTTTVQDRARGMAMFGVAMGSGHAAGPVVAAAFVGFGLAAPFYAVAGLSIIAGCFFWVYVVEPPKQAIGGDGAGEPLAFTDVLPFYAISTLTMTALATLQQSSGFYFQDKFSLTPEETTRHVGIGLMALATASVISQVVFAMRFRMAPRTLLRVGIPIALAGSVVLLTADAYILLVVGMGIFGVGFGMVNPGNVAALSIRAQGHGFGKIVGYNTAAIGLGFAVGPMIGSALYEEVHPLAPYCATLGFVMSLLVLAYGFVKIPKV